MIVQTTNVWRITEKAVLFMGPRNNGVMGVSFDLKIINIDDCWYTGLNYAVHKYVVRHSQGGTTPVLPTCSHMTTHITVSVVDSSTIGEIFNMTSSLL